MPESVTPGMFTATVAADLPRQAAILRGRAAVRDDQEAAPAVGQRDERLGPVAQAEADLFTPRRVTVDAVLRTCSNAKSPESVWPAIVSLTPIPSTRRRAPAAGSAGSSRRRG